VTYLSRFEFHTARREARRLIASPSAVHGAVLAAFRDPPVGRARDRLLWRIDIDARRSYLYVLSTERPDLTHLVEAAGWANGPVWETAEYDSVLDGLVRGQHWYFRLVANPTRSVRDGKRQRSRRVGHVTSVQQLDWLVSRGPKLGIDFQFECDLPQVQVTGRSSVEFRHGSSKVSLSTARFEGVMRVEEPQLLRQSLLEGIGPGKAYGCGLMTIAPYRPIR
jgi:CRISPR system Cascade subunit CasE